MRVNLIGNFGSKGLMQDAMILRGLLANIHGDSVQIRKVHHSMPQCAEAEINIFIEVVNPSLISYAAKNIWIPNTEWTYQSWIPYIKMVDEIWAKTREARDIFLKYTPNVQYIGWTSIDKTFHEKKNFHKGIVLVGKNSNRNPKPVLQAYLRIKTSNPNLYALLPELVIPYNPDHVQFHFPADLQDKVTLISKVLTETEYDDILRECGLAICTSATEGFGHAVNEAMSSGCNLIVSNIPPFLDLTDNRGLFIATKEKVEHPIFLGNLVDVNVQDLMMKLHGYVNTPFKAKEHISEKNREAYEVRHAKFVQSMQKRLADLKPDEYVLANTFPPESELPDVSIVTLTYNRRIFMPLAQYSYMIQSYPENKLEWVIVDDGEDSIEDTLIGIPNVKYVRLDTKTSIGEKRNIGVQSAMYNTIVMMDDDDVYPNNSVLHRVAMMGKQPKKQCVFTTTIPCYDIQKHISFMNVPPYGLPMAQRLSEASLAFTRQFWEDRKFTDIQIAEGNAFIHGREEMCREVSPQEVIVSLVHSKNTSSRKVPQGEPNGCHYGFNEQLFAVVSLIGDQLNTSCQKETGGGGESSCVTYGDGVHPSPQAQPQAHHQEHHRAS
jgi:glycosyltransferase involved in cell wall biosynthesis